MRTVDVKLLPDGSGRVRIHWFRRDPAGRSVTPSGVILSPLGPLSVGGVRGEIACQPGRGHTNSVDHGNNSHTLFCHTDETRATTCPECMATPEYQKAAAEVALLDMR